MTNRKGAKISDPKLPVHLVLFPLDLYCSGSQKPKTFFFELIGSSAITCIYRQLQLVMFDNNHENHYVLFYAI